MVKRKIIVIDEKKCTGCGKCIPNCPEGALQIIDGKARLVSDLFCDGLGGCIGYCPENAIRIEERNAGKYSEKKVMENIVKQGSNVIRAHLEHLQGHGEKKFLKEALDFLKKRKISNPLLEKKQQKQFCSCLGSNAIDFSGKAPLEDDSAGKRQSRLRQWPIQLHLVSPEALIDSAKISSLAVATMEVPCCRGLLQIAIDASKNAKRKIKIKSIVVGISGNILKEEWV